MFENKKNVKLKKLAVVGTTLALVMSLSVAAFADNQPGNGSNAGGMDGQRPGFEQTDRAGGADNGRGMNPQQGNAAAPGAMNSQDQDSEREDMTPPEDADAEPGEGVPAKPENDNQQEKPEARNEKDPMKAPGDKPDGQYGIDMMAVGAYVKQAGDSVDANVKAAYDALSEALTADPEQEGENDNLADLESALTEALDNAGVDLTEYKQASESPAEPAEGSDAEPQSKPADGREGQPEGAPETTEAVEASHDGFIQLLNRFVDFLRNL